MSPTDSRQQFFVSPSSFDNIGAVLRGLGDGFAHEVLRWGELKSWRAAAPHDVLFLNCALRFGFGYAKKVAGTIGGFVAAGGTLYASDWAMVAVQAAFPTMIELDSQGAKGATDCDVVDRGLQEMIGKRIDIEFDMASWRRIVRVDSSVRVYLAATGGGSAKAARAMPIVVGFRHGDGHVLCTSFHNKAQVSEQERRLLRFLVLQPILARAAGEATQAVSARQFQPGEQIYATIDPGQTSPPFVFDAAAGQSLLYFLNWTGAARLRLTIRDPSGNVHFDKTGDRPPLGCEVARGAMGRWSCQIAAVDVPHGNFPFVLTLAAGSPAKQTVSSAPARPATGAATSAAAPVAKSEGAFYVPPPPPPKSPTRAVTPPLSKGGATKIPPPPPPKRPNAGK